uniref:Pentacotripeptide-repeat region of PRORP domain-containing protein n=1 Tax=Chromera velia CCMP2878 TaxID=1169474 RepID=A0A0G4H4P3_9ALVE|eukprot:Cvel_24629.t1-p1 / transcript=Cvel_24629.t1 / gene=Cvel_24629 / organism=Chromera_velia_CCMP2878 / gene_product=Pentatricopeptide repeat-containing protein, putative / transcript_product=Pentatricopeptide repeat-containing protein, putative / location=Cvel_scaffold2687:3113-11173(+) / protein_length=2443 / sequence_SO=supercontig / SO=protein_coding / is_pseudo=false
MPIGGRARRLAGCLVSFVAFVLSSDPALATRERQERQRALSRKGALRPLEAQPKVTEADGVATERESTEERGLLGGEDTHGLAEEVMNQALEIGGRNLSPRWRRGTGLRSPPTEEVSRLRARFAAQTHAVVDMASEGRVLEALSLAKKLPSEVLRETEIFDRLLSLLLSVSERRKTPLSLPLSIRGAMQEFGVSESPKTFDRLLELLGREQMEASGEERREAIEMLCGEMFQRGLLLSRSTAERVLKANVILAKQQGGTWATAPSFEFLFKFACPASVVSTFYRRMLEAVPDVFPGDSPESRLASVGLLRDLVRVGVPIDSPSVSSILSRLLKARDLQGISESVLLLQTLEDGGQEINMGLYESVLQAMTQSENRGGYWRDAMWVLERMEKRGGRPSVRVYNSVLSLLAQAEGGSVWREAEKIFERLQSPLTACTPDTGTYSAMLENYSKAVWEVGEGGGHRRDTWTSAQAVAKMAKQKGVSLDLSGYTSLIHCARSSLSLNDRWGVVLGLWDEMVKKGITPDSDTAVGMLKTLELFESDQLGMQQGWDQLCPRLRAAGIDLTELHVAIPKQLLRYINPIPKAHLWDGFHSSLDVGGAVGENSFVPAPLVNQSPAAGEMDENQRVALLSSALSECLKGGEGSWSWEALDRMLAEVKRSGLSPDTGTYTLLLRSLNSCLEAGKERWAGALNIVRHMDLQGVQADWGVCLGVISAARGEPLQSVVPVVLRLIDQAASMERHSTAPSSQPPPSQPPPSFHSTPEEGERAPADPSVWSAVIACVVENCTGVLVWDLVNSIADLMRKVRVRPSIEIANYLLIVSRGSTHRRLAVPSQWENLQATILTLRAATGSLTTPEATATATETDPSDLDAVVCDIVAGLESERDGLSVRKRRSSLILEFVLSLVMAGKGEVALGVAEHAIKTEEIDTGAEFCVSLLRCFAQALELIASSGASDPIPTLETLMRYFRNLRSNGVRLSVHVHREILRAVSVSSPLCRSAWECAEEIFSDIPVAIPDEEFRAGGRGSRQIQVPSMSMKSNMYASLVGAYAGAPGGAEWARAVRAYRQMVREGITASFCQRFVLGAVFVALSRANSGTPVEAYHLLMNDARPLLEEPLDHSGFKLRLGIISANGAWPGGPRVNKIIEVVRSARRSAVSLSRRPHLSDADLHKHMWRVVSKSIKTLSDIPVPTADDFKAGVEIAACAPPAPPPSVHDTPTERGYKGGSRAVRGHARRGGQGKSESSEREYSSFSFLGETLADLLIAVTENGSVDRSDVSLLEYMKQRGAATHIATIVTMATRLSSTAEIAAAHPFRLLWLLRHAEAVAGAAPLSVYTAVLTSLAAVQAPWAGQAALSVLRRMAHSHGVCPDFLSFQLTLDALEGGGGEIGSFVEAVLELIADFGGGYDREWVSNILVRRIFSALEGTTGSGRAALRVFSKLDSLKLAESCLPGPTLVFLLNLIASDQESEGTEGLWEDAMKVWRWTLSLPVSTHRTAAPSRASPQVAIALLRVLSNAKGDGGVRAASGLLEEWVGLGGAPWGVGEGGSQESVVRGVVRAFASVACKCNDWNEGRKLLLRLTETAPQWAGMTTKKAFHIGLSEVARHKDGIERARDILTEMRTRSGEELQVADFCPVIASYAAACRRETTETRLALLRESVEMMIRQGPQGVVPDGKFILFLTKKIQNIGDQFCLPEVYWLIGLVEEFEINLHWSQASTLISLLIWGSPSPSSPAEQEGEPSEKAVAGLRLVKALRQFSCNVDLSTMSDILWVFGGPGSGPSDWQLALDFFRGLKKEARGKKNGWKPGVLHYQFLFQALARASSSGFENAWVVSLLLREEMLLEDKLDPDAVGSTALLASLKRAPRPHTYPWELVVDLIEGQKKRGVIPTASFYELALHVLANAGTTQGPPDIPLALDLYEEMVSLRGVSGKGVTKVLACLSRGSDPNAVPAAERIFDAATQEIPALASDPTVVSGMIAVYAKCPEWSLWRRALSLYEGLDRSGSLSALSALFRALARAPGASRWRAVLSMYDRHRRGGHSVDSPVLFDAILEALEMADEPVSDVGKKILMDAREVASRGREMVMKQGHYVRYFRILLKSLKQEAGTGVQELMRELRIMCSENVSPPGIFYTCLLFAAEQEGVDVPGRVALLEEVGAVVRGAGLALWPRLSEVIALLQISSGQPGGFPFDPEEVVSASSHDAELQVLRPGAAEIREHFEAEGGGGVAEEGRISEGLGERRKSVVRSLMAPRDVLVPFSKAVGEGEEEGGWGGMEKGAVEERKGVQRSTEQQSGLSSQSVGGEKRPLMSVQEGGVQGESKARERGESTIRVEGKGGEERVEESLGVFEETLTFSQGGTLSTLRERGTEREVVAKGEATILFERPDSDSVLEAVEAEQLRSLLGSFDRGKGRGRRRAPEEELFRKQGRQRARGKNWRRGKASVAPQPQRSVP